MKKIEKITKEDLVRIQKANAKKNDEKTLKNSFTTRVQRTVDTEIEKAKKDLSSEQSRLDKLKNETKKTKLSMIEKQKNLAKLTERKK